MEHRPIRPLPSHRSRGLRTWTWLVLIYAVIAAFAMFLQWAMRA